MEQRKNGTKEGDFLDLMNYFAICILAIIGLSGLRGLTEGFVRTTFRLALNLIVLGVSIFLTPILVRIFFRSLLVDGAEALRQIPLLLIVFVLLRFGARVLVTSADLIAKLPVIRTMNRFLGFFTGVLQGLLVVWTAFTLADFFPATSFGVWINSGVQSGEYVKLLYDNNPLRDILRLYLM